MEKQSRSVSDGLPLGAGFEGVNAGSENLEGEKNPADGYKFRLETTAQ